MVLIIMIMMFDDSNDYGGDGDVGDVSRLILGDDADMMVIII